MPRLINLADMDVAVLLDKDYEAEWSSVYLAAKRNRAQLHPVLFEHISFGVR